MGCILTVLNGVYGLDSLKWGVCIRGTAGRDREVEGSDAVFGVRGNGRVEAVRVQGSVFGVEG